ncbi:glycoside hydrolase family 65 protein, partial [Bacteroidia bacterium]|nr:glycoside hydrolase family 65 protein [Bacteroidia bacterium]
MKNYIKHHPWQIIEEGFDPSVNRVSESIFSIGNGKFGQRANFEERYTGDSLQGNYVAGVYYPDKTRVGWWKNGYPEYFAKVLNAPNWTRLNIRIDGVSLDLAKCTVHSFNRTLDMRSGVLTRSFIATLSNGINLTAEIERFCSLDNSRLGAYQYRFSVDKDAEIKVASYIDGKISNEDSNYDEKFWEGLVTKAQDNSCLLIAETKKTEFHLGVQTFTSITNNGSSVDFKGKETTKKFVKISTNFKVNKNSQIIIDKRASIISSLDVDKPELEAALVKNCQTNCKKSFEEIKKNHIHKWAAKWEESDIKIEGDVAAQQAIRFNIFQLNCTYTGEDERLNIGPKGFTGEKYGGSTYWDTEAYCLPFYQATADQDVARNLLIYRYKHLDKAIE